MRADYSSGDLIELAIRAALESAFVLALILFLLVRTDLRSRLFALGAGRLTVLYLILAAWYAVQMADRWQYFYPQQVSFLPLTRFAMYQKSIVPGELQSYRFAGQSPGGSWSEVNATEPFRAIGLPALSTRMRTLLSWAQEEPGSDARRRAESELRGFAGGLLRYYRGLGRDYAAIRFDRVHGDPLQPSRQELFVWSADQLGAAR